VTEFTPAEIQRYFAVRVPAMAQRGKEWRSSCPVHRGKDPNFAVSPATGLSTCHSQCSRSWDVLGLEIELTSVSFAKAKESVYAIMGRPAIPHEDREIEAIYDYTDEKGALLYQVVRKFGKRFRQRRPREGGWLWNIEGITSVPFQLPRVIASDFVAVCEGEKDAIGLTKRGLVGTCNNGGAGHFASHMAKWFSGKRVAIFADNDDKGRTHALSVAAILSNTAASVRIVELPGLPAKGDVSDFFAAGGTIAQVLERYQAASEWSPNWEFAAEVPSENDKFVRTFDQTVADCGGLEAFWDLTAQEGIQTPWIKLSWALGGGLRPGEVYIIGGNQGSGKSSLALQFILHTICQRGSCLLFSMEMPWRDVFQRLVAISARVDLMWLRDAQRAKKRGEIAEDADLKEAIHLLGVESGRLAGAPLFVSNRSGVNPAHLLEETVRISKRQKLDLVVVDHMQLMSSTGQEKTDTEKFTAISRATKQAAMEMRVPVLVVSQTSRSNSSEKRSELEVSDLRSSGALEEDAAAVMLLYPDSEHKKQLMASNQYAAGPVRSWVKLGKNRYGLTGLYLPMTHHKKFTRFDYGHDE
jgi:replicative DNA helicase